MENISKQLLIIAITAFIIGTIIGYQIKPQKQTIIETEPANIAFPSEDGIIRVGYIATSQSDMEYIEPIINEIIEPDINHYVNLLGHNFTFEFVLDHADGQAFIHQKKVEKLNDQGIDIFIGGLRSSMAQISLGYVNEKNMLMVSPRSKSPSPLLTLPDDMLFRTCPTEFHQAPILVDMIESMGISHVIVLQRADGWGDGIYELFISEWVENGGVELFRRRYPGEEVEYSKYLVQLDHVIQEAVLDGVSIDRIGVLFLGFDEQSIIAVQSLDYPFTRNVLWFKPFYDKMRLIDEPECVQLRFFYPYHSPYKSKKMGYVCFTVS